jgi:hypothetical protein
VRVDCSQVSCGYVNVTLDPITGGSSRILNMDLFGDRLS